jgi:hypothetical protein
MTLLAVDRTQLWAAAFRFCVHEDGDWVNDTVLLRHRADGAWEDMTSGGARGSGWPVPWTVPAEGWDGRPLIFLSRNGLVVEDDAGDEIELSAMSGFAGAQVAAVRVTSRHDEHVAHVVPPANAVVVLVLGSGRLTALDENGHPVAEPRNVG